MNRNAAPSRARLLVVFLAAVVACVHAGTGKGLGSDAEIAFYAAGPVTAFDKYATLWKSGGGDRCDVNAKMMSCTAAVAGGGPANEKRIADTGLTGDEIMRRSFSALESDCGADPESQSEGARDYAIYYRRTHRVGLGLRYAEKALTLSSPATYERMAALDALADVYDAMGWFEQRDDARRDAIDAGRAYFKFDSSERPRSFDTRVLGDAALKATQKRFGPALGFSSRDQVRLWVVLLETALEEASWSSASDRIARMRSVWEDLAFMCPSQVSCQLIRDQYPRAAIRFARAGDAAFAQSLYDGALAVAPEHVIPAAMLNFDAAAAALAQAHGKLDDAADHWESWLAKTQSTTLTQIDPPSADDYGQIGLAEEAAGRLDKAIEHFEKSVELAEANRASFDVQSRLRFLRGRTIRSYWGLVRSYAARHAMNHDTADFDRALRVASMLNARQFGELLGIDESNKTLTAESLHLATDEMLLVVVQTDKAVVTFCLTTAWKGAHVFRDDIAGLDERIRKVRKEISKPSGIETVRADLAAVGAAVLSAFRDRLAKAKALTVVSDGLVAALPFALFPESDAGGPPLVAARSVAYAPSLPFLAAQRAAAATSVGEQTLALGDPLYGPLSPPSRDPRARTGLDRAVSSMKLVTPLPETREEAQSVFRILGGRGTVLLGADATESKLKALALDSYGFIHLATHGVLGNQLPGLGEPALLLAAEPGQDAFLTMSEVQGLKLRATLTVLSACDTGSGQYFEGEGVMGLGRAFLLAGSRGVLATLWPIESESTVEFMKRFYTRLGHGDSPANALRATQLDFLGLHASSGGAQRGLSLDTNARATNASVPYRDPYFWAPFILLGGA